jgi:penicillin-binding protein 1A
VTDGRTAPVALAPAPSPRPGRLGSFWRDLHPAGRAALAASAAVLLILLVGWTRCGVRGCPDVRRLASYRPGGAPVLLDREGRPFGDLAPVEGELVTLKSLPKHVPQAFLAVEDRRFYEHGAVDWMRVPGALWANLRSRKVEEGSSTITMQLARNVFPERIPGQERTLARKLLEVRVAFEIEGDFEKDEILELYLNHIYFGNGARGIEAAARHYFGIHARELTLPQAALLAALPKGPGHYDPRRHPREARERRDLVLSLMEEQDRIEEAAAGRARAAPLGVARRRAAGDRPVFAGYFIEEVRRQLEELMGGDLYDQRLRIRTTLDSGAQRAAEQELQRQLQAIESGALGRFRGRGAPLQGAVVMMGAVEGDVLAWVGGRDFNESRFDRVKGARRQAGSAFKPFVYAAALDGGHTLSDPLSDEPLRMDQGGRRFWEPHNFDDRYDGQVTLREALVRSKNVPTVRLAQDVGTHAVAAFARDAGIQPPISEEPSMALGTVAVSPLELTAAYTAFAGLGTGVRPRLIVQVEDPDKEVLWSSEVETRRVLDPAIAYLVNDALRDALLRGTGQTVRQAGFQGSAAGKTGTTNDGADAWFVGYDPQVVATAWIGFDRPQPIMAKATGGRLAAPVWARIMERLYAGRRSRPRPWPRPDGIVAASVDPGTGMVLAPGCLPLGAAPYRELFLSSRVPRETCPARGDLPTIEPFMDYPEMDEEIVEVPLDDYEPAALPPAPPEVEAEEAERAAPAPEPSPMAEPEPQAEPESQAEPEPAGEAEPEPPPEPPSPEPPPSP